MAALVKQPVQVVFGSVEQRAGAKTLGVGRLKEAVNVYQKKTREFVKRNGFGSMTTATDTGIIGTGLSLVNANGSLALQTTDAAYVLSAAQGKWLNRGTIMPVVATATTLKVAPNVASLGGGEKPATVVENGRRWVFSAGGAAGGQYKWSVYDDAKGIEIVPPTLISATQYFNVKAVVAGGFVWLFAFAGSVFAYKFNPASPASAPSVTTYGSAGGGTAEGFDVLDAGAAGVVVATSGSGAYVFGGVTAPLVLSFLDTTTGLPKVSPGFVGAALGFTDLVGSFSFLKNEVGATGFFYVVLSGVASGIRVATINKTTLAVPSLTGAGNARNATSGICGYRDGFGNYVIFLSDAAVSAANSVVTRQVWNGASWSTPTVFGRQRSCVSEPFLVGSTWMIVTAVDDLTGFTAVATHQSSYVLQDATTARILGRTLYQSGGDYAQRGGTLYTAGNARWNFGYHVQVRVDPSTFAVTMVVNGRAGGFDSDPWVISKITWQPSAGAPDGRGNAIPWEAGTKVLLPGAWPTMLAEGGATAFDVGPQQYPRQAGAVAVGAGGSMPAGDFGAIVVYKIVDRANNIYRSAPSPAITVTTVNFGILRFSATPSLRIGNFDPSMSAVVEYYITSAPGGSTYVQVASQANDPTVDVMPTMDILSPSVGTHERLYSENGAVLDHIAPPPFTAGFFWKNRIFLHGTDELKGAVWPSLEVEPSIGVAFNEKNIFRIAEGTGDITAGGVIDNNYAVLMKSDGAWFIQGDGPDEGGHGSYVGIRVPDAPGCTAPKSCVTTPLGLAYQAVDGGLWLINRGLQAVYIAKGVDNFARTPPVASALDRIVTAAVHWPERNYVVFFTKNFIGSKVQALVWDYGNPLPEEGSLGQWYVWELPTTAGQVVTSATILSGILNYLDAQGVVWFESPGLFWDGSNTPILRRLKFPIVPSGIRGYQRLYRGQVVGQFISAHSLKVTVDTYAGAPGEAGSTSQSWTKVVSAGPELFEFRPNQMKASVYDVTIEDAGTDLTAGSSIDGLALEVGLLGGLPRVGSGQRL